MDWKELGFEGDPILLGSQNRQRITDLKPGADHE
jgi:hypothetical protein